MPQLVFNAFQHKTTFNGRCTFQNALPLWAKSSASFRSDSTTASWCRGKGGITKAAADAANEKSIIGLYRTCVKFVMHDVTQFIRWDSLDKRCLTVFTSSAESICTCSLYIRLYRFRFRCRLFVIVSGASTLHKRWSKCFRKILGGVFCQRHGKVRELPALPYPLCGFG